MHLTWQKLAAGLVPKIVTIYVDEGDNAILNLCLLMLDKSYKSIIYRANQD